MNFKYFTIAWLIALVAVIVAFSLWGCSKRVTDNFYILVLPIETTTTTNPEIGW
jgi:hypothetical protein